MITNGYLTEMSAFNRWQNDTVYGLCDEIGEEERLLDRGMFFRSIHRTLDHICMVHRALVTYLEDGVPPKGGYGDMVWPDWDELKAVRLSQDTQMEMAAGRWQAEWLAEVVEINSPRMPEPRMMPRWVLAVQIFNHQTHHRSQVTSALHAMGIDYGTTDIPFRPGSGYFVD